MLCQHCNLNQATVDLHMNINGQEQHLLLCPQCAKQLEAQYFGTLWPFSGLFARQAVPVQAGRPASRPEISGEPDPALTRRRTLSALRTRLDAAVKSENYEEAVSLREQIKRLDNTQ